MRILFVCENYIPHYGGAEVVFKNLAENMAKQGHKVMLVTHQLPKTPHLETMKGVHIVRVPCFNSRYLFSFFAIPTVLKLAKHADIIQTTTFNGAPPAWFASRFRRVPVVLTVHEVWVNKWRKLTEKSLLSAAIHNILEKMIYLLPYSKYICVSNATRKALLKIGIQESKVVAIHNGFNYEEWKGKHSGKKVRKKLGIDKNFVLFSWGRPGTSKGHEDIIKAMPKIKEEIPKAKLVLMLSMQDEYRKEVRKLKTLIKNLFLEENVQIINSVPYGDLGNYIKAADCVVHPSLSEGFGYAVLEACELGVPVIASDNASLPEVIWGKYILIPPKSHEKIAEAVVAVSKGKYKKSKKKLFKWKDSVKKYISTYKELLT